MDYTDYADYWEEQVFDEKELSNLRDAKQWVEELIDAVYRTGETSQLENALDELAAVFDLRLPSLPPVIGAAVQGKKVNRSIDLFDLGIQMMKTQGGM